MNLRIDDNLRIVSDTYGYIIQERKWVEPKTPDKQTGVIPPPHYEWAPLKSGAYYGKLEHALGGLLDYRLLNSDATTLAELAEEIAKHKREIKDLFAAARRL